MKAFVIGPSPRDQELRSANAASDQLAVRSRRHAKSDERREMRQGLTMRGDGGPRAHQMHRRAAFLQTDTRDRTASWLLAAVHAVTKSCENERRSGSPKYVNLISSTRTATSRAAAAETAGTAARRPARRARRDTWKHPCVLA